MIIIAFGYRRGCGKDTLARMIQRELRLKHKSLRVNVSGFADQLKQVTYSLWGWLGIKAPTYYEDNPTEKDREFPGLPHGAKSPRDLWIKFGNYCREFDPNVWMNALLRTTTCDVLLIKDLRFPMELEEVLNIHGKVYNVNRPGTDGADGEPDTVMMNETRWTGTIENKGTLEDLHKIACDFAETIVKPYGS